MKLVIVESPGKINKISSYLGDDYIVKASIGHVQELDKKTLSIDVDNNFKPYYITSADKIKVVSDLKYAMKDCNEVILAMDGDREGEAIAQSLATVLNLTNPKRIIFHEITKSAILKSINNPTIINQDMVNAQQARRLLDRLMGYKISPILWKEFNTDIPQSAGRVQSAVLNIIINKENEVNDITSLSYLKTTCIFNFNTNKINSVLQYNNKTFQFNSFDIANTFIQLINKKTIFNVISIDNKLTINKAPTPFITSSLQQEASTKLKLNIKNTMEIAQKLYEKGLITYMRTDCPNISQNAIDSIQDYIIKQYGDLYSAPKNYSSKNSNSQDAHECIRPTDINNIKPELTDVKQQKLYELIWKRTIASQMTNAKINIQTILIDCLNNNTTILKFNDIQTYFCTSLSNIEFDGYLIIYNNIDDDDAHNEKGKLDININDNVLLFKLKIAEEFSRPPLRFNEATLVKFLEKNGIGRPSTYASTISKIIERNYVEIKNIEGIKKQIHILELDNKFKIKESEKEISIGNEVSKIVPTESGIQNNKFLILHFESIINIHFTAEFETFLDKIATGKANWITVLQLFYDKFNPIVEKLNITIKKNKELDNDLFLGKSDDKDIYSGSGKYGPYIKIKDNDIWKYTSIPDNNNITLEEAITFLSFPKILGKISKTNVTLCNGKFGFYIKYNNNNFSIKPDININDIDLEFAKKLLANSNNNKTFKLKDKIINVKSGEFGPYLQIIDNNNKKNISIPSKYKIDSITIEDIIEIIQKNKK